MLDGLSAMEYLHWMMTAGAILVAAGFIGLAFHRNRNVETDQKKLGRERPTPSNILEPEGDDLPEDEVPAFPAYRDSAPITKRPSASNSMDGRRGRTFSYVTATCHAFGRRCRCADLGSPVEPRHRLSPSAKPSFQTGQVNDRE